MPFIPDTVASTSSSQKTGGRFIPDTQQASSPDPVDAALKNLADVQAGQDNSTNAPQSGISGVNAVGVEAARGLGQGTGQLIADAGWLANAGGLFKNGIGNAIQQYGRDMVNNSNNLPETNLPGIIKGIANMIGGAAPTLATFGAGDILGAAKVGELATNAIGTLTNLKAAKYFGLATKAMGQGTLFGVVNAVDTAALMPENSNIKDTVNQIMDSGKAGFITGAVLTPIMSSAAKVYSQYGKKAVDAYLVGITGSEKAAISAADLNRTPGTYEGILKVDPSKPSGQNIELGIMDAKTTTEETVAQQHEAMQRQQELGIVAIKDSHEELKRKLEDAIREQKAKYDVSQKEIDLSVNKEMADMKLKKEGDLTGNYNKLVNDATKSYQNDVVGNSQQLQVANQGFDATIKSTLDLVNTAKENAYQSIIDTAPGDGFSAQSLVGKIKTMMQKEWGITLTKEAVAPSGLDLLKLSPTAREQVLKEQATSPRGSKWTATSRASGGQLNPSAAKVSKYLTDTLLPDLEEKMKTNNGIYTLDMLRETTKNIKALGYKEGMMVPGKGVIDNPGYASLDRVFRANRNIDSFIGSDASLNALKEAAMLDEKFYNIKTSAEEYQYSIANGVESKAKAFGKDLEVAKTLSKLEGHLELPVDSNLRLSNNMERYYNTQNEILAKHENILEELKKNLNIQKNSLADELGTQKLNTTIEKYGKKFEEGNKYIAERRNAIDSKVLELRKAEATQEEYKKAILAEKFHRANALNEIRTVGRGDVPLGRMQRSFLTGAGYATLFARPAAIPSLVGAAVLSPRYGITVARGLLKSSQTGILRGLKQGLSAGQSKITQRIILGNLLKSSRKNQSLQNR